MAQTMGESFTIIEMQLDELGCLFGSREDFFATD
jgi:hypothetical protein